MWQTCLNPYAISVCLKLCNLNPVFGFFDNQPTFKTLMNIAKCRVPFVLPMLVMPVRVHLQPTLHAVACSYPFGPFESCVAHVTLAVRRGSRSFSLISATVGMAPVILTDIFLLDYFGHHFALLKKVRRRNDAHFILFVFSETFGHN